MTAHLGLATRLSKATLGLLLPLLITSCQKPSEYLYKWEPQIQENPVTEKRPHCQLKVSESAVFVGSPLKVYVEPTGLVTEVKFNKEVLPPTAFEKELNTSHAGKFEVEAIVEGPAGASSCSAQYEVKDLVPLCTLESTPSKVLVGESVTLTLKTTNKITKAFIGSESVSFPVAEKKLATPKAGEFTVTASVQGPGGNATCQTTYKVQEHPPTCTIASKPSSIVIGEKIEFSLVSSGVVSNASIEGTTVLFPQGNLTLTPPAVGKFTATGKVTGPGGENTCVVQYEVKEKPPTCTIAANPSSVLVGEKIKFTLSGKEKITQSFINGTLVNSPLGELTLTAQTAGNFEVKGEVKGPGGNATCTAKYTIKDLPPVCSLTADPKKALVGDKVKLTLTTQNKVTNATIGGTSVSFPTGVNTITVPAAGSFTATAEVEGPGGKANCQTNYEVQEHPPTCTLAAVPSSIVIGEKLEFSLVGSGVISSATIEGTTVTFPQGKLTLTPPSVGKFEATGKVIGPGGTNTCIAKYEVKEKPPTCTIAAKPASAFVGEKVVLTLTGQEKITESFINGVAVSSPVGELTVTPNLSGFYQGRGEVRGPGGKATCLVNYEVKDLPPACTLVADPAQLIVGGTVNLKLTTTNIITKATIDGTSVTFPTGSKPVVTTLAGKFTAKAEVEGPGGKASCEATYEVKEAPPSCKLAAKPSVFLLGGSTVLTLSSSGKVTSAKINNTTVNFPIGNMTVKPTSAGKAKAIGTVVGPGGQGTCEADYGVSIVQSFSKIVKEIKVTSDIDVLWIIDNSRSMEPYHKAVQDNTEMFMKEYAKVPNLKWKMGLISTDEGKAPYVGFTAQTLLNHESTDPVTIFKTAVGKLGTNGSGNEKTYLTVQKALNNYPDFLRQDAGLALMAITDEKEQSGIQTPAFLDFLAAKKGDLKKVVGYGAFGAKDLGCTPYQPPDEWNYKGSIFEQFINGTKGKYFPLCSPDFGQKLLDVTQHIIQNQSNTPKILLSAVPVPGTIQVRHKGNLLPEGLKPNGYWTYVAADNSILFNDLEFATGDKEEVEVTFQTVP